MKGHTSWGHPKEPRTGFAQLAPAHARLPQDLSGPQPRSHPTPMPHIAFSLGVGDLLSREATLPPQRTRHPKPHPLPPAHGPPVTSLCRRQLAGNRRGAGPRGSQAGALGARSYQPRDGPASPHGQGGRRVSGAIC